MNSNLLPSLAIGLMFGMAVFGAIDLLVTVSLHVQEWLRANRNINTEVPALKDSVRELQTRQSLLESDLQRFRRFRDYDTTISKSLPDERGAEVPGS